MDIIVAYLRCTAVIVSNIIMLILYRSASIFDIEMLDHRHTNRRGSTVNTVFNDMYLDLDRN